MSIKRKSTFSILTLIIGSICMMAFQNCTKAVSGMESFSSVSSSSSSNGVKLNHFAIIDVDDPNHTQNVSAKGYIAQNNSQSRWLNNQVTWKYNDSGRPSNLDKAQVIAALQESAAMWSTISGFRFHYGGEEFASAPQVTVSVVQTPQGEGLSVSRNCSSSSSDKIVGWSSLPTLSNGGTVGGAVAVCIVSSQLRAFGMKINSRPGYGDSIESVKKIAQHEFGHALGLGDFDQGDIVGGVCSSADINAAVMYGWADLGAALRVPNGCDSHYSQALYGGPPMLCTPNASQSCQTPLGAAGTQSCNAQGTAWGSCVATAPQAPPYMSVDYWGLPSDIPLVGRFFSDTPANKEDIGVYRPSEGIFYLKKFGQYVPQFIRWGLSEDIPVIGDYFGAGYDQVALFRPSDATWYVYNQITNQIFTNRFGETGDIPIPGKFYQGENKTILAVYRPSNNTIYVQDPVLGFRAEQFGLPGDQPIVGDFRGLGYDQIALFRPSSGAFYIYNAHTRAPAGQINWGLNTDVLLANRTSGRFTSAQSEDLVVYRPSNSTYYAHNMNDLAMSVLQWGQAGDIPMAGRLTTSDGTDNHVIYRAGVWYIKNK